MKEKAMYPGSFDPFTKGHEDIVRRISNFFSEIIISVVDKPNKKILFSTKERVSMIEPSNYSMAIDFVSNTGYIFANFDVWRNSNRKLMRVSRNV